MMLFYMPPALLLIRPFQIWSLISGLHFLHTFGYISDISHQTFILNSGKTRCKLFSRSPKSIQPTVHVQTLQGSEIETVECYKYLKLWLDTRLTFKTHVEHLWRSKLDFCIETNHFTLLLVKRLLCTLQLCLRLIMVVFI